jgi:diaminohydroxyphosphoribosylaminopyrimidine deaminase/5-amino-6-(5-phosphoribosylamino)uracil reductase
VKQSTAAEQETDRRFMAAAIRLARRNTGLTATNPSVATILVRDDGAGPFIIGSGVTAPGGRPHAEPQALAEAGRRARGATAYVTLEPCAHHGRTPPCAEALVTAGVARVVGAASDPDARVSGKGYAMLREAGVEVVENVLAAEAADALAGYLTRSVKKRPEVTLKLAISADGMVGRRDASQVAVTGEISRRQVHLMRAEADVILVGIGTALADDPQLTCRLPGLEARSPARIVLDRWLRLPLSGRLARSAGEVPLYLTPGPDVEEVRRRKYAETGINFLAAEIDGGRVALPELLDDLAAQGFSTVLVEGGARVAQAFLDEGLVDRLALFRGPGTVGADGVESPLRFGETPKRFRTLREAVYGDDRYVEYVRA